ncbi:MAG: PKD domain-containing protein [Acidobacteriota bacterium]|nr:PKD domain-containing protein [Acidobacteriota bacterium]
MPARRGWAAVALCLLSWLAASRASGADLRASGSDLPAAFPGQNVTATFATPGSKDVALTVCNRLGCQTVHQTVTVLDPRPVITSATASRVAAESGQVVQLTGTGAGQPPLAFSWQLLLGGAGLATLPGSSPYLDTTGLLPGAYTVQLSIQNASGTAQASVPLAVVANQPANFYTVTPCRVLDTRAGQPVLSGAAPLAINVLAAGCGIPVNARAVAANLTVVGPTGQGYLTLFPGNYPMPATSSLSFKAGVTRANSAVQELATDGSSTLAAIASVAGAGSLHLLVDVSGYFANP